MVKISFIAALVMSLGLTAAAAEIPMKLGLINKNNTTIADGVVTVNNTDGGFGGVKTYVNINQTAPGKIVLSGESMCLESLTKSKYAFDYSLYIDLTFQDGTPKHSINAPFSTTDKEWQKKAVTLEFDKPIKQLRIYIQYRKQTGKVQFRNLKLEEIK